MRLTQSFATHQLSWSHDLTIIFYLVEQLTPPPVSCFGNHFFKFNFFKIRPEARDPRFAGLPPCTRYTFSYIPSVFCRNVLQYFCIRRRRSMKYEYEWKHQHSLPKCRIYKGSLIIHWRFFRNRGQCTIHMTSSAATLKAKSIRLIQTCMLTG